jgi:hypothetical protein
VALARPRTRSIGTAPAPHAGPVKVPAGARIPGAPGDVTRSPVPRPTGQPLAAPGTGTDALPGLAGSPVVAAALPMGRLRRCTFRRLDLLVAAGSALGPTYETSCLYPDREAPVRLGDIAAAVPVCASCTAQGIFRPDDA